MMWLTDLAHTTEYRNRLRVAAKDRKLVLARAAKCARDGCHPVYERISRSVLRLAVRFHRWAAPEIRRSTVQMRTHQATLTTRNPHGWT